MKALIRMKSSFTATLIFTVLVTFNGTSIALGQDYQSFKQELAQIKSNTKFRIGPLRIFPTFHLNDLGYDNNVYYQHKDEEVISDYTVTFSPELSTYAVYRSRIIFSLLINPEYVYYLEQKQESGFNLSFSPGIKFLAFKKLVLGGEYFWNSRNHRVTSEFDVRVRELSKGYSGSMYFDAGKRISLGFTGSMQDILYENIDFFDNNILFSRNLNREVRSAHFELYYNILKQKGDLFLNGGYTDYKFNNVQSSFRNSQSYQVYTGIHFPLLGMIRGKLSAGYKKLTPRSKEEQGFAGLVVNSNLRMKLNNFVFQINYQRDFQFSYWTNNIYFNEDIYGGRVNYYLNRFIRLDYSLNRGRSRYPKPLQVLGPGGEIEEIFRTDEYRIHTAGIVFKIKKEFGLGISINFWKRDSNHYWANRERSFIGMVLTTDF